jgi:DNA-binding MarR family transcriptional regulator
MHPAGEVGSSLSEERNTVRSASASNRDAGDRRFAGLLEHSGQDAACSRPVIALLRADGRVGRAFDHALSASALTEPQFNVLMELAANGGGLPHCTLAHGLLKSPANVTSLVDRMQRDGLVRRVRSELDRRTVVVEITQEGWGRLKVAAPAVFAAERAMLAGLSAQDRDRLRGLLDRVAAEQSH